MNRRDWYNILLHSVQHQSRFVSQTQEFVSPDATCQLNVFWHDGHTPGMYRTQICVFKQANDKGLARLLQGPQCSYLHPKSVLGGGEVHQDLRHKPLKRSLRDQTMNSLLVATNFFQRQLTWSMFRLSLVSRFFSGQRSWSPGPAWTKLDMNFPATDSTNSFSWDGR